MFKAELIVSGTYTDPEDSFDWRLVKTVYGNLSFEYKEWDSMGNIRWVSPQRESIFGQDYMGATFALSQFVYQLQKEGKL